MIKNYTISGLSALKRLPSLEVAQFTLNSRTYPSKRKTAESLEALSQCHNTKIVIHYDYIYIISRFAMFNSSTQNAILDEIHEIMNYASRDKNIVGIVMHTDWPLRKDCYLQVNPEKIKKFYSKSLWDSDHILSLIPDVDNFLANNIMEFYNQYLIRFPQKEYPIKIYLENTTKVPTLDNGQIPGSVDYLVNLIDGMDDLFGICVDTEHDYAVTGKFRTVDEIKEIASKYSTIVHLNTIPKEVKPGSLKDRHSSTTIFDCSLNDSKYYLGVASELTKLGIVFVREVHEDTMFKEMDQMKESTLRSFINE